VYLPAVGYGALVLSNGGYTFGKFGVIPIFPKKHVELEFRDDFSEVVKSPVGGAAAKVEGR